MDRRANLRLAHPQPTLDRRLRNEHQLQRSLHSTGDDSIDGEKTRELTTFQTGSESGNLQLPENAFVFALRGGEQFTFFIADGSAPDPAVYSYFENDGHFKKLSDSFWGFLEIERQGIENLLSERAHNEE